MLNLLGCSKDNFLKLIQKMNYKTLKKIMNFISNMLQLNKKLKNLLTKIKN